MPDWIRARKRWAIYLRDGLRCVYCGVQAATLALGDEGFLTLDHFEPRGRGGPHGEGNLVTACYACNVAKSSRSASKRPPYSLRAACPE